MVTSLPRQMVFTKSNLKELSEFLDGNHNLIFVFGSIGSGKTTMISNYVYSKTGIGIQSSYFIGIGTASSNNFCVNIVDTYKDPEIMHALDIVIDSSDLVIVECAIEFKTVFLVLEKMRLYRNFRLFHLSRNRSRVTICDQTQQISAYLGL